MLIAHTRPMIAQHTQVLRKHTIIGHTDSCFAICAQIFARIKTEAGEIAEGPSATPTPSRAECLGSVFYQNQLV